MGAVDEHDRIAVEDLQSARPARAGQSVAERAVGDLPPARAQGVDGGDRECRIVRLVQAEQRNPEVAVGPGRRRDRGLDAGPFVVGRDELDFLAEAKQRNVLRLSGRLDDRERGRLGAGNGDAVRFQDASLFGRDRLERRAEVLRVVERDVRDDADSQIEHVGRVQASTEAHLADQQVDAGAGEVVERSAGEDLELRRWAELGRNLINGGLQLREQRSKVILRNRSLVDLDALGVGDEVGLWHQADPVAGCLQDAGHHGADGALAVGAGHMDALEQILWIAELAQQRLGSLQAKLDAESAKRGQIVKRFLVGHPSPKCCR